MSPYQMQISMSLGIVLMLLNIIIETVDCDPDFDKYEKVENERSLMAGQHLRIAVYLVIHNIKPYR